jgi:hypothetical protein
MVTNESRCGAAAGGATPLSETCRAQGFSGSIQVPLKEIGRYFS